MIWCNWLKFPFIWNFHDKKCAEFSLTSFGTLKYDFVIKTIEMINFLPLINNSVTTGLSVLLLNISAIISSKTINLFRLCIAFFHVLSISFILFEYSVKALEDY